MKKGADFVGGIAKATGNIALKLVYCGYDLDPYGVSSLHDSATGETRDNEYLSAIGKV